MHRTVRAARVTAALATTSAILVTGHRWDSAAAAQFALALATAATIVGFGTPILTAALATRTRVIVGEAVQAATTELRALIREEMEQIRAEFEQAMHAAREDGQMDGILRERLGRLAGDPPRPRHRRPTDRLTDTGNHLRPIRD